MQRDEFVKRRVAHYYWQDDLNCATTMLRILAETFGIDLHKQIVDAATGMHGAGKYGAQCGLVEGTLMFLGIFGGENSMPDTIVVDSCKEFARQFESQFNSLQCTILRPEGFHPENRPHICEPLTCQAAEFSIHYISAVKQTLPLEPKSPRSQNGGIGSKEIR